MLVSFRSSFIPNNQFVPLHSDACEKMIFLCMNPYTSDIQWMQQVENTNWPSIIRLVLSASWQTAFHVHYNRIPVLLHCSVSSLVFSISLVFVLIIHLNMCIICCIFLAWMGSDKSSRSISAAAARPVLSNTGGLQHTR